MNTAAALSVTIIYPAMRVHRAGCHGIKREIAKGSIQADTMVNRSGSDIGSILTAEVAVDLADIGYTIDDYSVAPCAR